MIHRYIPAFADRNVPRYTSYPTAAEFRDDVGARDQAASLSLVGPAQTVSLYIHIPYCETICWYCGCNTGAVGRPERLASYVDTLKREIDLVAPAQAGRVVSVHFGGGSPNVLSAQTMADLASHLRQRFTIDDRAEWAIELDPRLLDTGQADALAAAGFRRVSLGVQTFSLPIQAKINRLQPFRTIARGVAELRAAGIRQINFDLLYGLPGQSLDDIAATIAHAVTLRPDRIAMFGYAHLPQMLPRQRMIDASALPGPKERFWQSALAHDLLVEQGYRAIGFDHYALPRDSLAQAEGERRMRRNFQGFTDDPADVLIGLGTSAISQFPGLTVQNEKHVGRYRMHIDNGLLAGLRGTQVTASDRLHGEAIERLLCDGMVDLGEIASRHAMPPTAFATAIKRLHELCETGIATLDGPVLALADWARPYARVVAAAFDEYRPTATGRFSRAV